MSDSLNKKRCPRDEPPGGWADIGVNPNTGDSVVMDISGVASVLAVQSAMMTLSAAMRKGHEKDFLEKVALSVFGKLALDPHALCPLFTICGYCLLMLQQQATVGFDDDGNLLIALEEAEAVAGHECVLDYRDEGDLGDGTDEKGLDGTDGEGGVSRDLGRPDGPGDEGPVGGPDAVLEDDDV